MPSVYILFSDSLNSYYTGCTSETVAIRLQRHNEGYYENKFTKSGVPWIIFLEIECNSMHHAMKVEKHIKSMKSKIYIQNL